MNIKISAPYTFEIWKNKKSPIRAENKIFQVLELLQLNEQFINDAKKIRQKYNLPVGPEDNKVVNMHISNPRLSADVEKLRQKYNLSGFYSSFLSSYLTFGEFSQSADFLLCLFPHFEIDKDQKCLTLKIYPETTIKDIQKMWPKIQKNLHENINYNIIKNRNIKNLKRDIEIYKLKLEGKKQTEITKTINSKYPNSPIAYQEVSKIISRLKKAIAELVAPQDS